MSITWKDFIEKKAYNTENAPQSTTGFDRISDSIISKYVKPGIKRVLSEIPGGTLIPSVRRQAESDAQKRFDKWYGALPTERQNRFNEVFAQPGIWAPGQREEIVRREFGDMPGGMNEQLQQTALATISGMRPVSVNPAWMAATRDQWMKSIVAKLNKSQTRLLEPAQIGKARKRGLVVPRLNDLRSRLVSQKQKAERLTEYISDNNSGVVPENFQSAINDRVASLDSRISKLLEYDKMRRKPLPIDTQISATEKSIKTLQEKLKRMRPTDRIEETERSIISYKAKLRHLIKEKNNASR